MRYNTHMESAATPADGTLNNEPQPVVVRKESEREIISWKAPSRPFKRYGRRFYVTIFSIVGIISIVLFIAEGIMPVILLISLIFLFYVLSTVTPDEIEYKITNKGIKISGKETPWQEVVRFWFLSKPSGEVLLFDTVRFPGRLQLVFLSGQKEKLKQEISAYVPYEEVPLSALDKLINWIIKKLPESE